MYFCKWFKDKQEAIKYQKDHGGALYMNEKYSRTKTDHIIAGSMFNFDAKEFRYSVNWTKT